MKNLNLFLSGSLSMLFLYFGFQFISGDNIAPPANSDLPYYEADGDQWYKMKPNAKLTTDQLLKKHSRNLGLGVEDEWVKIRSDRDKIGMTHHRYQMHHNGIPVSTAQLIVHEKDGFVKTFNGHWVEQLEVSGTPTFSKTVAIEKALLFAPADQYIWDNPSAEALHQHAHHDHDATFYPEPELIYYNPNYTKGREEFRLAYSMIITAEAPIFRKEVFIDANTGNLLRALDVMCTTNVPAQAETKYHGTVTLMTDSIAPDSFILRESTRGYGIETYNNFNPNMNTVINANGDEMEVALFTDTDNYWSIVNPAQDEVAHDAHYGAQVTFDMFNDRLDYIGVDGDSMAFINIVHVGNDLVNAFWNGSWASYGDGNYDWSPLTSLDVVGHEFTHGVTGNTAALIYMNESGALNESFSDIFGTYIEFIGDPSTADYLIGEDFDLQSDGFRNMMVPNADEHPDTYLGNFWEFGAADNGGVHSNSGVQNLWFYLLAEGGTGTNDNGYAYSVSPVGQDTAAIIAFRNLRYYLTDASGFEDARVGAVHSAEDLYGECSYASEQTKFAWRAVGVGDLTDDNDFEMLGIIDPESGQTCGMSSAVFPTIEFTYKGCQTPLVAGTPIPIAAQVNGGPIFLDTFVMNNTLVGGDTIMFTFSNPVSGLQDIGENELLIWMAFELDMVEGNNSDMKIIDNVFNQNTDFSPVNLHQPVSNCFMGEVNSNVQMRTVFLGCDSIEAGVELQLYYTLDGVTVVNESTTLTETYYRDDEFVYDFNTPFLNPVVGARDVTAWVKFADDFVDFNDSTKVVITNPKLMKNENIVTFEAGASSQDSFYLHKTKYTDGFISAASAYTGNYGYRMQGGDVQEAWDAGEFVVPDSFNVWDVNESLSTKLCHCVDGRNLADIELSFDLRQRYSYFFSVNIGSDVKMSSSMRVLVNDEQISGSFFPSTHLFEPWLHLVYDVSAYSGTKFEVCFETRNFTSPETADVGDYAQIDNVLISGVVSANEVNTTIFDMALMPNPTTGELNIAFNTELSEDYSVEVFDVHGRLLQQEKLQSQIGQNTLRLDVNHLSSGLYYVKLSNGELQQVEPLVRM